MRGKKVEKAYKRDFNPIYHRESVKLRNSGVSISFSNMEVNITKNS